MKRKLLQYLVTGAAKLFGKWPRHASKGTILVLRNNNIGDLLTTTPLFKALKDSFPKARIVAGIGRWNACVVKHNPYVDDILFLDAPWHNTVATKRPPNSFIGFLYSLFYILLSRQPHAYKKGKFDIGIDVLGSPQGSLLFLRMGIPYRLGVKGYAGGETACQKFLIFDDKIHVSAFALRFAELLGGERLPKARPQLFIKSNEKEKADQIWNACRERDHTHKVLRVLIGAGGSFDEKCWPIERYAELAQSIDKQYQAAFITVGIDSDTSNAEYITSFLKHKTNLCGNVSLRDTFSLCATADLVLCNSSMLMHVSAAFNKPTAVLLGAHFDSASAHARLWGYPETHVVLGKEEDERDEIYTAQEVFQVIEQKGWLKN